MDGLTRTQLWEAIRLAVRNSHTVTSQNLQAQYRVFKATSAMGIGSPEPQRRVDVNLTLEPKKITIFNEMQSAIKPANMPELVKVNLALEDDKGRILSDKA